MPLPHHPSAFDAGPAVAAATVAYVYMLGLLRLVTKSTALPVWRSSAFLLGVAAVWAALGSSLASCDADSLSGHMVQHLLLMSIAAPLLLLGEPVRVILNAMPRPIRKSIVCRLRRASMRRSGMPVRAAVACWLAASGTLVLWHVPAVFTLAMRSPAWHAVEQASFLVTGLLFWLPVIEPWPVRPLPSWSIVVYLFMATLPCDVLSGFLVFSDRIAYPVYLSGASEAAVLSDQQRAGALMWTCVTIVYLIAGTLVSARLLTFGSSFDRHSEPPRTRGGARRPAVGTARVG